MLDRADARDLAAWSHAWVEEARTADDHDGAASRERAHRAARVHAERSAAAPRAGVDPADRGRARLRRRTSARSRCTLNAARVEVAGGARAAGAAFVLPTGGGLGYGEFELDPAQPRVPAPHLPEIADALTRGSAW